MYQDVARGVGRGLAATYHDRTETPAHLQSLLAQLGAAPATSDAPKNSNQKSARRELDRYLQKLGTHLPSWLCEAVKWLRAPHRFLARALVSLLLISGGVFSFLPILGLWMLPLGLLIISQDLVFLQQPLLNSIRWVERRWKSWRGSH